jgi:hypothetical protein
VNCSSKTSADTLRRFVASAACFCAVASAAEFAADLSDRQLVERLVAQADSGESPSIVLAQTVGERGISAALVSAEFLDEQKPHRSQALYEVISLAATCRRSHSEVLRLYQPDAYRLFYITGQRRFAAGLTWKEWPAALPEAMVRVAPLPTLEWLRAQAASSAPALDKLRLLWKPLGWWLRSHNERQHTQQWHEAIAALTLNRAITSDLPTSSALLQLIADAGATSSLEFVLRHLEPVVRASRPEPATNSEGETPSLRSAAVMALGQMLGPHMRCCTPAGVIDSALAQSLPIIIRLAHEEQDDAVLIKLAAAAEAWPDDEQLGQAMLDLFKRNSSAEVRRAILFSTAKTKWPQRATLILAAFEAPDQGVLGVALQAVAAYPLPDFVSPTLALLQAEKEPSPHLIDAAGALGDQRATPKLLAWLKQERNVALRIKLALALEKIPGVDSGRALTDMLEHETEPLLAEHLCRIASRRDLPNAVAVLVSLAEDITAPMVIRGQAIWALGHYAETTAGECLKRLADAPQKYFADSSSPDTAHDSSGQARLFVTLAGFRQNMTGIDAEVARCFESGTPAARLTCLLALTEINRDHPIIASGLESGDFAVLLGAVRAASASNPSKYYSRFVALRDSVFVSSLLTSGLDSWGLPAALDEAIRKGSSAAISLGK